MRPTLILAFAAVSLTAGIASADDRLHVAPPLYREQARATQQTSQAARLTTTPQTVSAAASQDDASGKVVALAR